MAYPPVLSQISLRLGLSHNGSGYWYRHLTDLERRGVQTIITGVGLAVQPAITWRRRPDVQRVTIWLLGVVAASLLPVIALVLHAVDNNNPLGLVTLLSRGDLLLIGTVVTIGSFADLARSDIPGELNHYKGCLLVICALTAVIQALWYSDLAARAATVSATMHDATGIALGTLVVYLFSIVTSGACIKLSEARIDPVIGGTQS
jgi:hypothetical protein